MTTTESRGLPDLGTYVRLSLMMFLQYAIWGAWLPILFPFLNVHREFTGDQIGNMFAVGAVGAIVAPFVAGQIADRWFSTEKFLGISHLIGGVLIWQLGSLESYWAFLAFSLVYSLVYSPTLPLTNSLAFHHLPDRDRGFGFVRVWGTIGWIVASLAVAQWLLWVHTPSGLEVTAEAKEAAWAAGRADAFRLSGALGIAMGVFCFFLPHTPPSKSGRKSATLEALGEIRHQPLVTLFFLAVPISCIHQFYFVHTAGFLSGYESRAGGFINKIFGVGGGGLMTVGQMTEIGVLALIPLVSKTVPRKALLAVGIVAYALRMALFAYVDSIPLLPPTLVLTAGIALHGLCFGCFIFVAFMVVDEETAGDVRASAQSLFNLFIIGIGVIVGSKLATGAFEAAKKPVLDATGRPELDEAGFAVTEVDFTELFSAPMWASLGCLVLLFIFYSDERRKGA